MTLPLELSLKHFVFALGALEFLFEQSASVAIALAVLTRAVHMSHLGQPQPHAVVEFSPHLVESLVLSLLGGCESLAVLFCHLFSPRLVSVLVYEASLSWNWDVRRPSRGLVGVDLVLACVVALLASPDCLELSRLDVPSYVVGIFTLGVHLTMIGGFWASVQMLSIISGHLVIVGCAGVVFDSSSWVEVFAMLALVRKDELILSVDHCCFSSSS